MASQATDGTDIDRLVELYIHFFPLPFHHHAHLTMRPAMLVWSKTQDGRKVHDYSKWLLNNQNTFLSQGRDLTEQGVIDKICSLSKNRFGYTEQECLDSFITEDTLRALN